MIDLEERFDTVEEMNEFLKRIIPINIYDDVELLQSQVAELKSDVTGINNNIDLLIKRTFYMDLEEGTDLNSLTVGKYVIPNGAIAGTLINKPSTAGTMTGFVAVVPGGNSGQLIMFYVLCSKTNVKYWQRAYYQNSWSDWTEIDNSDTGWIDLPLSAGITAYSETQKPRYRKIGKIVYLSGVLRGVTERDQTVATLPVGYRPSMKVMFAVPSVGQIITKMSIDTNGAITLNRSTIEPIVAENWHSIACDFIC